MTGAETLKLAAHCLQNGQIARAALLSQMAALGRPEAFNPWMLMGVANSYGKIFPSAAKAYKKALIIDPTHHEAQVNCAAAYVAAKNWPAAITLLRAAIKHNPAPHLLETLLGIYTQMGDVASTATCAKALNLVAPSNFAAITAMAKLDAENSGYPDRHRAARIAILAPNDPVAIEAYCREVMDVRQPGQLEIAYERTSNALAAAPFDLRLRHARSKLSRDLNHGDLGRQDAWVAMLATPSDPDGLIELIKQVEQASDLELAEALLRAGKCFPKEQSQFLYLSAIIDERRDRFDAAIAKTRHVLFKDHDPIADHIHITAANTLGAALDKSGAYSEAFEAYKLSNDLRAQLGGPLIDQGKTHIGRLETLKTILSDSTPHSWSFLDAPVRAPIFMVGFPRSGTTLLDQIIDSHDKASVLEEKSTFETLVHPYEGNPQAFVDYFSRLNEQDAVRLRHKYWALLDAEIPPQDGVLPVDKMPLRIIHVWAIVRLFPNARFIVSLRHPADCILSCFMQTFRLNVAMANFLDIGRSFEYYEAVMSLWRVTRARFAPNFIEVRYEDIVADSERERGRVYDFLGLDAQADLAAPHEHAQRRQRISTPSFRQVVRPIYGKSVGRWSRYSEILGPYFDIIRPSVKDFGYDI